MLGLTKFENSEHYTELSWQYVMRVLEPSLARGPPLSEGHAF